MSTKRHNPQHYPRGGATPLSAGSTQPRLQPQGGGPSHGLMVRQIPQQPQAQSPKQYPIGGATSQPPPYCGPSRPQLSSTNITQHKLSTLSLVHDSSPSLTPVTASSKINVFPLRPGVGVEGTKCTVKANHFFADLPEKDLYQYDETISPEDTPRGVNRAVMKTLVERYRESHLGNRLPVYDGQSSLYTADALPFDHQEFQIDLDDTYNSKQGAGDNAGVRRSREFKLVMKKVGCVNLHRTDQEALQVLDIVLRALPTSRYVPIGRSFYSPLLGHKQPLGEGLECWRGFYQSIRPTQMGLSLNIDMLSTAFIEPLPVIEFVAQLLNRDVSSQQLSDADHAKIKEALRGIKVEVTHRVNMRRKYRISGLTSQATRELT